MNIKEATALIQQEFKRGEAPMVWSVAGSDNTGGAGIQADNKVFDRFGVRSANIVTAVTAQNHTGLHAVHVSSTAVFDAQWQSLIQQEQPAVIKLGMLANTHIVSALLDKISRPDFTVVCDPVLKATSGGSLLEGKSRVLYHKLLEHIDVLTPNQEEFCQLFSVDVNSLSDLILAAEDISKVFSLDLIITGGEANFSYGRYSALAIDVCVIDGETFCLESPMQDTSALHGTGCSFSSAIAASVALGYSVKEAVVIAKAYLNQGLSDSSMKEELAFLSEELVDDEQSNTYPAFQQTQFPWLLACLPNVVSSYQARDDLFSCISEESFPVINDALGLYPVVDSIEWLEKCLQAGVGTIQLRVKDITPIALDKMVEKAASLGR
ncbi:MAG: bifunctional hydroxymethylpyrimidine kinase/phosphomethylpyrimidine kinase, partial [Sinobacterium sp.]|nr:bifunctional hydroxymethylpyrimidine kinase/phosphomethylpyrimidine kinase [Sinobacterium sp.]